MGLRAKWEAHKPQQMMNAVVFTTSHSHRVTVDKYLILSNPRAPPPFPLPLPAPQPSPPLPVLPRRRIGIAETFINADDLRTLLFSSQPRASIRVTVWISTPCTSVHVSARCFLRGTSHHPHLFSHAISPTPFLILPFLLQCWLKFSSPVRFCPQQVSFSCIPISSLNSCY